MLRPTSGNVGIFKDSAAIMQGATGLTAQRLSSLEKDVNHCLTTPYAPRARAPEPFDCLDWGFEGVLVVLLVHAFDVHVDQLKAGFIPSHLRPHMGLDGRTPAQVAGLDLGLDGIRWKELIRMAAQRNQVHAQ